MLSHTKKLGAVAVQQEMVEIKRSRAYGICPTDVAYK